MIVTVIVVVVGISTRIEAVFILMGNIQEQFLGHQSTSITGCVRQAVGQRIRLTINTAHLIGLFGLVFLNFFSFLSKEAIIGVDVVNPFT